MWSVLKTTISLSAGVRVRKETWGLLFYSQLLHRMFLVRSGDWLYPRHFDGSWELAGLKDDISRRLDISSNSIDQTIGKVMANLKKNGIIVDGLL